MTAVSRRSLLVRATAALAALPMLARPTLAAGGRLVSWDKATIPAAYPKRVMGSPRAPVAIIEYSSLTCPHCAHFHTDTLPQVKKTFLETGKAFWVVRDFPLDQLALAAALIVRSAPEEIFFPFLETLFARQKSWLQSKNPLQTLRQWAVLAGMSASTIDEALTNEALLQAIIEVRSNGQEVYGIDSTPSFMIDGHKHVGDLSYGAVAKLIAKAS